ncbi:MAG: hypothetical protein JSW28_03010 [Thermoplasmata archaeon]|nr:MAG: hypothetical protein JSW28_03010 [Thermoplasmata archaeon]
MPKQSKKGTKKKKEDAKKEEVEEEIKLEEEIKKTSIPISTKVRDRLYWLKFRKTYDEFLWELCEMYEEQNRELQE